MEEEVLTKEQQLNEYIMTSLRTMEGLSLQKVLKDYGEDKQQLVLKTAIAHIERAHLSLENDCLKTTSQGKLLADGIAADFFVL